MGSTFLTTGLVGRRRTLLAAIVAVITALGLAAEANALDVQRLEDRILDPNAHARITYEGTVNAASYQQDGIITHKGWQYTAWYTNVSWNQSGANAVIARRQLPDGPWESTLLDPPSGQTYGLFSNDSHNTIALGITPRDGRLHVTFPTHDNPVRYTRTVPGVVDHPEEVEWTSKLFEPVYTLFPGATGAPSTFTYPQFENVKVNGQVETLLTWRDGITNNGRQALLRYDNNPEGTWTFLGRFTHNTDYTYNGGFGNSTTRYGYIHGFTADPESGRIAVGISWREQNSAWCTGPQAVGNHDLGFTYSDDGGATWRNNAGTVVANTTTGSTSGTITPGTPGIIVEPIGINKGLINQEAQNFDREGRIHIVTSRVPDNLINSNCVGDFYAERLANAYPYHHWRDASGTWHTMQLPQKSGSAGRTKIAFDSENNAYIVMPDGRIMAATAASNYTDWHTAFHDPNVSLVAEAIIDRVRVREDDVLTIAYQEPPAALATCRGTGNSDQCRSAFRLASFKLNSDGPDAGRDNTPLPAPRRPVGWSDGAHRDLGVAIDHDLPVVPGKESSFSVRLRNHGELTAKAPLSLDVTVPAGYNPFPLDGDGWVCDPATGDETFSCTYGRDLKGKRSAPPLRVGIEAPAGETGNSIEVSATVTPAVTRSDLKPANNRLTAEIPVVDPADDSESPTLTRNVYGNFIGGQYVGGAGMVLEAEDEPGGSGIETIEYRVAGGPWIPYTGPVMFSEPGLHPAVQARALDRVGNVASTSSAGITVGEGTLDEPTVEVDTVGETDEAGRYLRSAELSISGSAAPFGVHRIRYRVDGGSWQHYDGPFGIDEPGFHEIDVKVTDRAGRVAEGYAEVSIRPDSCDYAHSDEFNGSDLDFAKWDFKHHTTPLDVLSVDNGHLVMPTAAREIDGTEAGPVHFIGQPLPDGDWTAVTKLSVNFTGGWQFAGLMLYQSDTNLFRVTFEHNNASPGQTFVRTVKDDPPNHSRLNSASVAASSGNPGTILLRMRRNGNSLEAAYTFDTANPDPVWTTVPLPGSTAPVNTNPPRDGEEVRLGLVAGGNWSAPTPAIARFDFFRIQDEESESCPDLAPPSASIDIDPPDRGDGSYSKPPTFTLAAADDEAEASDLRLQYRFSTDERWRDYEGGPVTVEGTGDGVRIYYRAIDPAGNITADSRTIDVRPEPVLALKIKPKSAKLKGSKKVKVKLTVTNTGSAAADAVKLCAKGPKKKVKVKACTNVGMIAAGAGKTVTLKVSGTKKFKKGKAVVKLSLRGNGPSGAVGFGRSAWKITLKR